MAELEKFGAGLHKKPRWLVFNKLDLMANDVWQEKVQQTLEYLNWDGPWYAISAVDGRGTKNLCADIMHYLENREPDDQDDASQENADKDLFKSVPPAGVDSDNHNNLDLTDSE